MQTLDIKELEIDKYVLNNLIAELIANSITDKKLLEGVIQLLPKLRAIERFNHVVTTSKRNKQEISFFDIVQEIEVGFERLRNLVKDTAAFKNPYIMHQIISVTMTLQSNQHEVNKAYFKLIYQQINSLFYALLAFEFEEIVKEFAIIKIDQFPCVNVYTGKWEAHPKTIREWKFAPTLTQLHEINALFISNEIKFVWVALELLFYLERCWNTAQPIAESSDLNRNHWEELDALKNGSKKNSSFFHREKMKSCLRVIMKEMFQCDEIDVTTNCLVDHELDLIFSKSDFENIIKSKKYQ